MRLPYIKDVVASLLDVDQFVDDDCDVRLQVYLDGDWALRWGDPSYDLDHRGYWGVASVPGGGRLTKKEARNIAIDLRKQVAEHASQCGEEG